MIGIRMHCKQHFISFTPEKFLCKLLCHLIGFSVTQFIAVFQFIDSLNRYSLLIIDDLGIERNSEFALEQVFNVIDSRYRSKKPLIVTTNLTLEELNKPTDMAHSRIYDRILERCAPIRINNRNIRKDNASANLQEAKKILLQ